MPINTNLKRFFPLFLVIIIFASRIPVFTGNNFVADGDEAIVGLMAKEIIDKGDFKIYFWGQQYGMAIVETATGALAFRIFGMNVYSLKLAMLFLWAIGVLFLFAAVKNISGWQVAVLFSLLLIACPAWGLWSMKARGGYITAFVFSAFTAWLMSMAYKNANKKSIGLWILIGLSVVVVWYAQKLWLFSLLPLIAALFINRRNLLILLSFVLSVVLMVLIVRFLAHSETSNYWTNNIESKLYILYNIPLFLSQLHVHFSGGYSYESILKSGQINEAVAWAWSAVFVLLLVLQLIRVATRKFLPLSHLFFLSACFSTVAFFNNHSPNFDYRYLLPVDVPLVLCFVYECRDWASRAGKVKFYMAAMPVFIILNFWGLFQLKNADSESNNIPETEPFPKAMAETISFLKSKGIYNTFSPNPGLFWQIMFYSQKQVMSRFFSNTDRNPEYTRQVTDAFKAGKPVALIDPYSATTLNPKTSRYKLDPARADSFGNQIRVYLYPDRKFLENMQFDLK